MTSTPRIMKVRGAAEVIALLPYQFGYQPRRSLVLITLRRSARGGPPSGDVGPTVRVDLPPPGAEAEVAVQLLQVLAQHPADIALLLAFEEGDDDTTALLRQVAEALESAGVLVDTAARVRAGRWLSIPAGEAPAAGPWLAVPPAYDVPAVADYVFHGSAPTGDRGTLCSGLDAPGPVLTHRGVRDAVRRLIGPPPPGGWETWARAWGATVRTDRGARGMADLTPSELAGIVRSLEDRRFRDGLLAWLTPGQYAVGAHDEALMTALARHLPVSRPRCPAVLGRLYLLAVRIPHELRCPVLSVLAVLSWWHGNGTLANIAVERALEADPDYRLALLVEEALQRMVPPPPLPWQAAA